MRFRTKGRVPYLNKRDQYRMLLLVGTLCVVIFAITFASKPKNWYWISAPTEEQEVDKTAPDEDEENVMLLPPDELIRRPGEFLVQPNDTQPDPDQPEKPPGEEPVPPNNPEENGLPPAASELLAEGHVRQIRQNLFTEVEDRMGIFTTTEEPAYWEIMALLREIPSSTLSENAKPSVAYTALEDEPDIYRGQLLTFEGELRLVKKLDPLPNPQGINERYELWLSTPGSGNKLLMVHTLSLPEGLDVKEYGEDSVPITVSGYFYRLWGYRRVSGGSTVAPWLLAKDVELVQSSVIPSPVSEWDLAIGGFIFLGLLVLIAVGLVIYVQKKDRQFEQDHLSRFVKDSDEQVGNLNDLPAETAEDYFASLSEENPSPPENPDEK